MGSDAFESASRITPEFRQNRDRFKPFFPAAYDFLCYLGADHEPNLRLGTSKNAHLYRRTSFLMYIRLDSSALTLSPRYHNKIDEDARDESRLLFPEPLRGLIERHGGFAAGWARAADDGSFEIRAAAPPAFLTQLIELARTAGVA